MNPVIWLILTTIRLYTLVVFIYIAMRLLVNFGVIAHNQPFVVRALHVLGGLVEPALGFIRDKFLGNRAKAYFASLGLDPSPVILFLGLGFVWHLVVYIS